MSYHRVGIRNGTAKHFQICVSVSEGFGNKRVHPVVEAMAVVGGWQVMRANKGLPFLSGMLSEQTILFCIGRRGAAEACREPLVVFSGTVSVRRTPVPADEEVVAMIEDLAARLGTAFRQTRVNVEYRNSAWVLEADNRPLPEEPHLD